MAEEGLSKPRLFVRRNIIVVKQVFGDFGEGWGSGLGAPFVGFWVVEFYEDYELGVLDWAEACEACDGCAATS